MANLSEPARWIATTPRRYPSTSEGHPTYLEAKAKGDNSMSGKRERPKACRLWKTRKTCEIWRKLNCLKPSYQGFNRLATPTTLKGCPVGSTSRDVARALPQGLICRRAVPSDHWPMTNEVIQGNERAAYVSLERLRNGNQGIAYGARALWRRSHRSSPRTGKPSTWRRVAGDYGIRSVRYA